MVTGGLACKDGLIHLGPLLIYCIVAYSVLVDDIRQSSADSVTYIKTYLTFPDAVNF